MTATMSAARKALNVALRIVELTVVRPFERKGCRSGSPPSHHAGSPGPLAACAPHVLYDCDRPEKSVGARRAVPGRASSRSCGRSGGMLVAASPCGCIGAAIIGSSRRKRSRRWKLGQLTRRSKSALVMRTCERLRLVMNPRSSVS